MLWTQEVLKDLMEEKIPFNQFLGLKMVRVDQDGAELMIPFRPEFIGDVTRPALHGGLISMLIDTCGGAATFAQLEVGYRCSTVDLTVDYIRPGPTADIYATAKVVRRGNRVCLVNMEVTAGEGDERTIIAQGRGVFNIHAPKTA
tara:strand:+ start:181 stop:615 length:435 start_codon:yes stop_codon:yes gene_type:complete